MKAGLDRRIRQGGKGPYAELSAQGCRQFFLLAEGMDQGLQLHNGHLNRKEVMWK